MTERDPKSPPLKHQGLYPCEAEIARRLSQSEKHWRQIAPQLERQWLPKIDPIMKGRFWPAGEALFRSRHRLGNVVASQSDGEKRWGRFCGIAAERALKQVRQARRKALPTLEHRLGDRSESRKQRNE
jgi:hypothetical protein